MDVNGNLTPAGNSFAFMQQVLGRGNATDVSPDELTFADRFGKTAMVIWGAPRDLTLAAGVSAYTPTGQKIAGPVTLLDASP